MLALYEEQTIKYYINETLSEKGVHTREQTD